MSELRTNRIVPRDGLVSGTGIGGGIIQVKSVTKTDTFTKSSGGGTSFVDVTGLSVSITPTRSDSKILVMYDMQWASINGHCSCRLMRDSTSIFQSDSASNRPQATYGYTSSGQYAMKPSPIIYMDSPSSTSALAYSVHWRSDGSATGYMNRTFGDRDNANYDPRGTSSIVVMEVLA